VTLITVLVVATILLGLVFALVGAIMEFVFIESLRTGDVSIRRSWSDRWRQGLRLFGFRIAIGLPALGLFVGWLAVLFVAPCARLRMAVKSSNAITEQSCSTASSTISVATMWRYCL
jgi:hypothetical protein